MSEIDLTEDYHSEISSNDELTLGSSDDESLRIYEEFLKVCGTQDLDAVRSFYTEHYAIHDYDHASIFAHLCQNNYLEIARWYHSIHPDLSEDILDDMVTYVVGEYCNLEMAHWICSIHTDLSERVKYCAFNLSCVNGKLELAKWIYSLGLDDLEVAQWIHSLGLDEFESGPLSHTCLLSIGKGHLDVVDFLLTLQPDMDLSNNEDYPLSQQVLLCIQGGHLEMAKWLFQRYPQEFDMIDLFHNACTGCSFYEMYGPYRVFRSISTPSLPMVQWIHSVSPESFDVINQDSLFHMISSDRFEIIQWIHSLNPIQLSINDHEKMFRASSSLGYSQMTRWLFELRPIDAIYDDFELACTNGHLHVAELLCFLKPGFMPFNEEKSGSELNIFEMTCNHGKLDVAKWLYSIFSAQIDVSTDFKYVFRSACENGYLDIVQWIHLIQPDLDICFNDNAPIKSACGYGHLPVAQWILSVRPDMDLHAEDEDFFCIACESGKLEIAKWLLSVAPDINIRARGDNSFKKACENNHPKVVKWLVSLKPEIYSYELERGDENNITILFRIHGDLVLREMPTEQITGCCICYSDKPDIITECNHQFCTECIHEWMKRQHICPYCRTELFHQNLFKISPM